MSHLLLEGPALLTFGAVASKGAFVQYHNTKICVMNHANNLLSVINATIPFFVFLVCNQQFRHMSTLFLRFLTTNALHRHKKLSTTLCNTAATTTMPFPSPRLPTVSNINEKTNNNLLYFRSLKLPKDQLYYNENKLTKIDRTKSSVVKHIMETKTITQPMRLNRQYSEAQLLIQTSNNTSTVNNVATNCETKLIYNNNNLLNKEVNVQKINKHN